MMQIIESIASIVCGVAVIIMILFKDRMSQNHPRARKVCDWCTVAAGIICASRFLHDFFL